MTDYKVIADNLNKINPPLEIPDGLTKDKWPYYLSYPYLSIYGGIYDNEGKDYSKLPLTYEILSDVGKIAIITVGYGYMVSWLPQTINFEFRVNNGDWQEYTYHPKEIEGYNVGSSEPEFILDNLVKGDIVEFRSNNNKWAVEDYENEDGTCVTIHPFPIDEDFEVPTWANVYGNILSLFPEDPYDNENVDLLLNRFFCWSTIKSAENLILPDFPNLEPGIGNTTREDMFSRMFSGSSIEIAPKKISAKVAGTRFCEKMFEDCYNLHTTPDISSIIDFGSQSFEEMFINCVSLTKAPILPKHIEYEEYPIQGNSFSGMFLGCENLSGSVTVPIGNGSGLNDGFQYGCYNMFKNCESLEQCILDIKGKIGQYCLDNMFENCTSLKLVDISGVTEIVQPTLSNWLKNAGNSDSIIKIKSGVTLPSGDSGIPSYWNIQEV